MPDPFGQTTPAEYAEIERTRQATVGQQLNNALNLVKLKEYGLSQQAMQQAMAGVNAGLSPSAPTAMPTGPSQSPAMLPPAQVPIATGQQPIQLPAPGGPNMQGQTGPTPAMSTPTLGGLPVGTGPGMVSPQDYMDSQRLDKKVNLWRTQAEKYGPLMPNIQEQYAAAQKERGLFDQNLAKKYPDFGKPESTILEGQKKAEAFKRERDLQNKAIEAGYTDPTEIDQLGKWATSNNNEEQYAARLALAKKIPLETALKQAKGDLAKARSESSLQGQLAAVRQEMSPFNKRLLGVEALSGVGLGGYNPIYRLIGLEEEGNYLKEHGLPPEVAPQIKAQFKAAQPTLAKLKQWELSYSVFENFVSEQLPKLQSALEKLHKDGVEDSLPFDITDTNKLINLFRSHGVGNAEELASIAGQMAFANNEYQRGLSSVSGTIGGAELERSVILKNLPQPSDTLAIFKGKTAAMKDAIETRGKVLQNADRAITNSLFMLGPKGNLKLPQDLMSEIKGVALNGPNQAFQGEAPNITSLDSLSPEAKALAEKLEIK